MIKKLIAFAVLGVLLAPQVFAENVKSLKVKNGSMNFMMDAPLEKIKGKTSAISGQLKIQNETLESIQGEILLDISKIQTYTFEDQGKNKTQNDHMFNWFEIGDDVDAAKREQYKTATLKVNGAQSVKKISDDTSVLTLQADLTVHGITKTVPVVLNVKKQAKGYQVKTAKPIDVGLVEHDIRPRDLAGKLLKKTLEALGQKVAKYAQVDVDVVVE